MTRTEEVFNREMEFASAMRATMDVYWSGYAAGLMRALFGDVAVHDRYHCAWMQADAPGEQARGYRDGYCKLTGPFAMASTEPGPAALPRRAETGADCRLDGREPTLEARDRRA